MAVFVFFDRGLLTLGEGATLEEKRKFLIFCLDNRYFSGIIYLVVQAGRVQSAWTSDKAVLCNGSTADSDSVRLGSNPGTAAKAASAGNLIRGCFLRGVAQFGRALRSGRRSRRFKSCHLDHGECSYSI